MATACKHPKVRIVSRHDDAEFVECLECGEVFDSEEFRDMEIEEALSRGRTAGRALEPRVAHFPLLLLRRWPESQSGARLPMHNADPKRL